MERINIQIKGEKREKIRKNRKKKWIKHGEGKWKKNVELQTKNLSRQRKRKIGL